MSGEAKEFVDTNVLVYAVDSTAGEKTVRATALLDRLWFEASGCCSIQVLQEFHHVVTRKIPRPLPLPESLTLVRSYASWVTFAPAADDVIAAISLQMAHPLSFWDALLVHGALTLQCQVLWTEDLQHGQRFGSLTIQNPFLPVA